MAETISIAVAQTCAMAGDVTANLRDHLRLAQAAADAGANLILFPELSLTGYEVSLAPRLAFSPNDSRLEPLLNFSKDKQLTLIAGGPFLCNSALFLGAFIFSPKGEMSVYTKQRLGAFPPEAIQDSVEKTIPPAEASVFKAGNLNPEIHIQGTRIRLAICADIGNPSHPAVAASHGTDLYLASMFVIPSDYPGDSQKLEGYAKKHRLVVGLANYGAPTGGLRSAGRSGFWSNRGELLGQLPETGSGIGLLHWNRTSPNLAEFVSVPI